MSRLPTSIIGVTLATFAFGVVAGEPPSAAPPPHPAPEHDLKPGRRFAAKGRIDLFVAATANWNLPADDDRLWEPALDLADILVEKSQFRWWPPADAKTTFGSITGFRAKLHPSFLRSDSSYRRPEFPVLQYGGYMAPGISSAGGLGYSIAVSRGDVRTAKLLSTSIVYANGDVTVGDQLSNAIVVCDGDVSIKHSIDGSLVVARGSIRSEGVATGMSTLVAGGKIKLADRIVKPKYAAPVVQEETPIPFEFVRFFELSSLGIEVKAAGDGVKLVSVKDGVAEAVELKVGDVIIGVNGRKPDSPESLRRLLRDALAVGDATVTLRRGEKIETVKVSLPD